MAGCLYGVFTPFISAAANWLKYLCRGFYSFSDKGVRSEDLRSSERVPLSEGLVLFTTVTVDPGL